MKLKTKKKLKTSETKKLQKKLKGIINTISGLEYFLVVTQTMLCKYT